MEDFNKKWNTGQPRYILLIKMFIRKLNEKFFKTEVRRRLCNAICVRMTMKQYELLLLDGEKRKTKNMDFKEGHHNESENW